MAVLDNDMTVLIIVAWSLLYATIIGPAISMHRLLSMLPTHGGSIIAGILEALDTLTDKEAKDLKEKLASVLSSAGPGGMPLKPMKWYEFLIFQRAIERREAQAAGKAPAGKGAASAPAAADDGIPDPNLYGREAPAAAAGARAAPGGRLRYLMGGR